MTGPKRVQRRRTKGWRMPKGAIYVGRPTAHGNPYRVVNPDLVVDQWGNEYPCAPGEAAGVAVRHFRDDVATGRIEVDRTKLHGRDLVCWCGLGRPCHGDVLLELANARDDDD